MSDSRRGKTPDDATFGEGSGADPASDSNEAWDDELDAADSGEVSFLRAAAATPEVELPRSDRDSTATSISKYEVLEEIGRGGMGVVYAAEDQRLRRRVALKVLPEKFAADPERRRRFLREARATSAITHANVATVFDVDETANGSIYIAMELVQGKTLRALLQNGPLEVSEAARIGTEILRGLSKAHEVGIVHRDIKPDNVMVTVDGSVKLLDFGLAKPFGTRESALASKAIAESDILTLKGRVMGTPSYMSPEQARGEPVDERSDIFSFGVLLYEILTGRRPFDVTSAAALVNAVEGEPPARISTLNPRVPRSFDRLVERCLQEQPSRRFAKCSLVVRALDGARRAPLVARASMITLLLTLVVVAVAVWTWLSSRPDSASDAGASAAPAANQLSSPTSAGTATSSSPLAANPTGTALLPHATMAPLAPAPTSSHSTAPPKPSLAPANSSKRSPYGEW